MIFPVISSQNIHDSRLVLSYITSIFGHYRSVLVLPVSSFLATEISYHETMLPFFFFFLELSDFQVNCFKYYCPFKKTRGFLKGLSQIISFSVTIPCHIINILLRCRTPLSTTEDTMSIHGSKNTPPRSWTNSSYSMLEKKKTYSSECGAEPVCISGISNCFCFYWPVFCLQLASVMVLWL